MKEQIFNGEKTLIELIESLRLGSDDYDLESTKKIKDGGQATILEIKSKKDGKSYAAKRLKYQIGYSHNDNEVQADAEREIKGLLSLNHPLICQTVDIIKDQYNFPCIIMEKCEQNLDEIIK